MRAQDEGAVVGSDTEGVDHEEPKLWSQIRWIKSVQVRLFLLYLTY